MIKMKKKNVFIVISIYEFWVNNGYSIEVNFVCVGKYIML